MDLGLVNISLDESGDTKFVFPNDVRDQRPLIITAINGKGLGLLTKKPCIGKGESLLSNIGIICASSYQGEYVYEEILSSDKQKTPTISLCSHCYHAIRKKAINRIDCKSLLFCSQKCLSAEKYFLDLFNYLIQKIMENQNKEEFYFKGIHILAMRYLYFSSICINNNDIMNLNLIWDLESNSNQMENELEKQSDWLFNEVAGINIPYDFLNTLPLYLQNRNSFRRLYRIIKFNSQPVPVLGLGSAKQMISILTLLPTLSRVNHSCCPNSTVAFDIIQMKTTYKINNNIVNSNTFRLSISLISVKEINQSDEISISYINQLCSSVRNRKELLSQAFHFNCTCERCLLEETQMVTLVPNILDRQLDNVLTDVANGVIDIMNTSIQYDNEIIIKSENSLHNIQVSYAAHDIALLLMEKYYKVLSNNNNIRNLEIVLRSIIVIYNCWFKINCINLPNIINVYVNCKSFSRKLLILANSKNDHKGILIQCEEIIKKGIENLEKYQKIKSSNNIDYESNENVINVSTFEYFRKLYKVMN